MTQFYKQHSRTYPAFHSTLHQSRSLCREGFNIHMSCSKTLHGTAVLHSQCHSRINNSDLEERKTLITNMMPVPAPRKSHQFTTIKIISVESGGGGLARDTSQVRGVVEVRVSFISLLSPVFLLSHQPCSLVTPVIHYLNPN